MSVAVTSLDDVPGWFFDQDQALFSWFLARQNRLDIGGDLLELGCYLGKSAILMGRYLVGGDRLTVCDLFEEDAEDADNQGEMRQYRATLSRQAFERCYLAFHAVLPTIVEGPSSTILNSVAAGSCRFAHVDASHRYDHVVADMGACRTLLNGDGLLVCDDFRAPHTPGVAAAVWGAVTAGELQPICLSDSKFYGTWGNAGPVQRDLVDWLDTFGPQSFDVQSIAGRDVVRIAGWSPPKEPIWATAPFTLTTGDALPVSVTSRKAPLARRVARDMLPPIVVRGLRALRPARE
jgi:predicted O-methyltransferase YrrM